MALIQRMKRMGTGREKICSEFSQQTGGPRGFAAYRLLLACALLGSSTVAVGAGSGWRTVAEQALQQALCDQYPDIEKWSITALTGTRQEQRLAEQSSVDVEVVRVGKRSAVRIWSDHQSQRHYSTVWFSVDGMQHTLTSTRDLPAASAVASAALVMKEHDVLKLGCEPLLSLEGSAGSRTTRRLRAGQAFCRSFLEPRPAVSRGETVTLLFSTGTVAIRAHAVAQQDGNLGQAVPVKRSTSIVPFMATVTGNGQVSIND